MSFFLETEVAILKHVSFARQPHSSHLGVNYREDTQRLETYLGSQRSFSNKCSMDRTFLEIRSLHVAAAMKEIHVLASQGKWNIGDICHKDDITSVAKKNEIKPQVWVKKENTRKKIVTDN